MEQESCLFCKIATREIPAAVIWEGEHALAFLDIHPRAPGHTMVIPRTHARSLVDLPEGEITPLFLAVRAVDQLLMEKLSCDGMTIGINQGSVSGQEVPHVHVHLFPRFEGDNGTAVHSVVRNPPHESIEEMVEKLTQK